MSKSNTAAILQLAKRSSGVLYSEIRDGMQLKEGTITGLLSLQTKAGRLTPVHVEGQRMRWFHFPDDAKRWEAEQPKLMPKRDRLLALLAEHESTGQKREEIAQALGIASSTAIKMLDGLRTDGMVHRGKRAGFGFRYFSTRAARDAWELLAPKANNQTTMVRAPRGPKLVAVDKKIKSRARNSHGPCISLPGSLTAPAVRAQHKAYHAKPVKRTDCPNWTHDPRYQVGPGEDIPRLFSSLPLGATLKGVQS